MLSRKRILNHPLSGTIDLPLLVPAFSSKGFNFVEPKNSKKYTEVSYALEQLAGYIKESMLISAYDLHHGFYRKPEKYIQDTSVVFLDSGGYELNPEFDSTEPKIVSHEILTFTLEDYVAILDRVKRQNSNLPLVIANYDWDSKEKPFEEQILAAQKLFNRFPDWLSDFIIKPQKKGSNLNIDDFVPHIEKLRAFQVVGVTEKELGKNLIDKLKCIAKLRTEMNKRAVDAPIHIWGGLDPLITPLYFFAGADIFDGVSWLRYVYHNGLAVNRNCFNILEENLTMFYDHARGLSLNKNLMELAKLATSLRAFSDSDCKMFDVFENNGEILKKAYIAMQTRIDELKNGGKE